jgi:hypothetical protein
MPGEKLSENVAPKTMKPGTKLLMFICRTEGCQWEGTQWPVQVNPDGSVPVIDHSKTPKEYGALAPTGDEQRLIDSVQRQLAAETQPGAEVKRRG